MDQNSALSGIAFVAAGVSLQDFGRGMREPGFGKQQQSGHGIAIHQVSLPDVFAYGSQA